MIADEDAEFAFLQQIDPNAARLLAEAQHLAQESPDLSVVQTRKCLEAALGHLAAMNGVVAQQKGENLLSLINRLAENKLLDNENKEIAHTIRRLTNPGAHFAGPRPTRASASKAISLLKRLLSWLRVNGDNPARTAAYGDRPSPFPPNATPPPRRPAANSQGATEAILERLSKQPSRPLNIPKRQVPGAIKVAIGLAAVVLAFWLWPKSKPTTPVSYFPTEIREKVATTKINVRAGPDPKSPTVKQLTNGDEVTALGSAPSPDGGIWHYVRLSDGSFGFVNSKLVQAGAAVDSAPASNSVVAASETVPQNAETDTSTTTNSPPQEAQPSEDPDRVKRVITSVIVHHDDGADSGEIPGRSYVMRVDAQYADAQLGDVAQGIVVQNGQLVGRCDEIGLQPGSGSFWCRVPVFAPGNYLFVVGVNRQAIFSREFVVQQAVSHPMKVTQQGPGFHHHQAGQVGTELLRLMFARDGRRR